MEDFCLLALFERLDNVVDIFETMLKVIKRTKDWFELLTKNKKWGLENSSTMWLLIIQRKKEWKNEQCPFFEQQNIYAFTTKIHVMIQTQLINTIQSEQSICLLLIVTHSFFLFFFVVLGLVNTIQSERSICLSSLHCFLSSFSLLFLDQLILVYPTRTIDLPMANHGFLSSLLFLKKRLETWHNQFLKIEGLRD